MFPPAEKTCQPLRRLIRVVEAKVDNSVVQLVALVVMRHAQPVLERRLMKP